MKLSNLASTFKKCRQEHRPALLTYTVSGDPNKKKSFEILKAISSHADICEIGIAHNCNTGDGKQIQDSTYRAIKNGIKIRDTFKIVSRLEKVRPSLEPAHAFAEAIKIAPRLSKDTIIAVDSCGDAKKDMKIIKERLGRNLWSFQI